MAVSQQKPDRDGGRPPAAAVSPAQSAVYTADLLENLRKIAQSQGQPVLAHLLELAHAAARLAARDTPDR